MADAPGGETTSLMGMVGKMAAVASGAAGSAAGGSSAGAESTHRAAGGEAGAEADTRHNPAPRQEGWQKIQAGAGAGHEPDVTQRERILVRHACQLAGRRIVGLEIVHEMQI